MKLAPKSESRQDKPYEAKNVKSFVLFQHYKKSANAEQHGDANYSVGGVTVNDLLGTNWLDQALPVYSSLNKLVLNI